MGLRSQIVNSVADIFRQIGDIAERAFYVQVRLGQYDPEAGTPNDSTRRFPILCVFTSIGEDHPVLADVQEGDMKVLFASKNLQFTPQTNDTIVRSGKEYEVISVNTDPVTAHYSLQVRQR